MKSKKVSLPVEEMETMDSVDAQNLDSEFMPLEEETDTVGAIMRRMGSRGRNYGSARFAYRDLEEEDYVSEQALHRVVEDLQFGHDLRL